ncbi:hypothetical protein EYF80_044789 [Liparis tanakae]|uniref:Uncharacterized protein n=1 Tax=Liparis tanakae TaxID=230148 RepID=A0A4Z2FUS1_9TELE|nr:hypothetical protein EYF80_044789 [Liparis tanakae]
MGLKWAAHGGTAVCIQSVLKGRSDGSVNKRPIRRVYVEVTETFRGDGAALHHHNPTQKQTVGRL